MGFDSLKGKVQEHTQRRDAVRREFERFKEEDERVGDAGKSMEHLDREIQEANYALQARYYQIERDFERQFEELEAEGDQLAEEISDELSAHGTATEKLRSAETLKYGEQAASARRMGENLIRELQDMMRNLERPPEGVGNASSGGAGGLSETVEAYVKKDANGFPFMTETGQLRPHCAYALSYAGSNFTYRTNQYGQISEWEGYPVYIPDLEKRLRDLEAQKSFGADAKLTGDHSSHCAASASGGTPGPENLTLLRDCINTGAYKSLESRINKAVKDGQDGQVFVYGKLLPQERDSPRPTRAVLCMNDHGKITELTVDNVQGSVSLLDDARAILSDDDYNRLVSTVRSVQKSGREPSILSLEKQMDEHGNITHIRIGVKAEGKKGNRYSDFYSRNEEGF